MASLQKLNLLAVIHAISWNCASSTTDGSAQSPPCLCAFDIDRTLTGYQDMLSECPGNKVMPGVKDYAYLYDTDAGYGNLTLSRLLQNLNSTFCSKCYIGIASAGGASLDDEKATLLEHLRAGVTAEVAAVLPETWITGNLSQGTQGPPPFVVWCQDETKHECTATIVDWYKARNVSIANKDVYFFDDKENNILAFNGSGFNAQQISCASRDGTRGFCGATPDELQNKTGIYVCATSEPTSPSEQVDVNNTETTNTTMEENTTVDENKTETTNTTIEENMTVEENKTETTNTTIEENTTVEENKTETTGSASDCHEDLSVLMSCGATCIGKDDVGQCATSCMQGEGLSSSCASCLGKKTACSVGKCLSPCVQPTSDDCIECAARECGSCETTNGTESAEETNGTEAAEEANDTEAAGKANETEAAGETNGTEAAGEENTGAAVEICEEDSAKLQDCGAKCVTSSNMAQCSSECLQDEGLSSGCASCLGQKSACSFEKCLTDCSKDPLGEACFTCTSSKCGSCENVSQVKDHSNDQLSGAQFHASMGGCLVLLAAKCLLQ